MTRPEPPVESLPEPAPIRGALAPETPAEDRAIGGTGGAATGQVGLPAGGLLASGSGHQEDEGADSFGGAPEGEHAPFEGDDAYEPAAPSAARPTERVRGTHDVSPVGGMLEARPGGTAFDLADALRSVFTTSMAEIAIAEVRVGTLGESAVELVGSQASVQYFRNRLDDVSRAVSGALGRRVRASIVSDQPLASDASVDDERVESMAHLEQHPLVLAAKRAFNAEVSRVEPARRMESNV